jgi:hypothetical protein
MPIEGFLSKSRPIRHPQNGDRHCRAADLAHLTNQYFKSK